MTRGGKGDAGRNRQSLFPVVVRARILRSNRTYTDDLVSFARNRGASRFGSTFRLAAKTYAEFQSGSEKVESP